MLFIHFNNRCAVLFSKINRKKTCDVVIFFIKLHVIDKITRLCPSTYVECNTNQHMLKYVI